MTRQHHQVYWQEEEQVEERAGTAETMAMVFLVLLVLAGLVNGLASLLVFALDLPPDSSPLVLFMHTLEHWGLF